MIPAPGLIGSCGDGSMRRRARVGGGMRGNGSRCGLLLCSALLVAVPVLPAVTFAGAGDCAQPLSSGPSPNASDCLFILQAAVSLRTCSPDPCICAPKGTLPIAATDALICLRHATGQQVALACPCTIPCDGNGPVCNGECPSGLTCGSTASSSGGCTCLNDCELGPAPACGGSCASENDPSLVCRSIAFSTEGGPGEDACVCIPETAQFCIDAVAPACSGVCQPGSACQQDGAACSCAALPLQGPCAQADAPSCGGTCGAGSICQDTGGACSCVAFSGQSESCRDEEAPICGGSCASGNACAVDFLLSCECFSPCELSAAPTCGGECFDDTETCTHRSVTLQDSTIDYCECRRP